MVFETGHYICTFMIFQCPHCEKQCWVNMGDTINVNSDYYGPEPADHPLRCWSCKKTWSILDEEGQGDNNFLSTCTPTRTYRMIHQKPKTKRKKKKPQ